MIYLKMDYLFVREEPKEIFSLKHFANFLSLSVIL